MELLNKEESYTKAMEIAQPILLELDLRLMMAGVDYSVGVAVIKGLTDFSIQVAAEAGAPEYDKETYERVRRAVLGVGDLR